MFLCNFVGFTINPLRTNPTKWTNTLKQPTNCLSAFDHFVGLAPKGLKIFLFLLLFYRAGNQGEKYCGNTIPSDVVTKNTVRIKLAGMVASSAELKNIKVEFVYEPLDGNVNNICCLF